MKRQTLNAMLLIGIAFFAACKSSSHREDHKISSADSTSVSIAKDTVSEAKLVKTGSINFKVEDAERTSETISDLTNKYNGMVMHHNVTSTVEQTKDFHLSNDSILRVSSITAVADITVKIPPAKVEDFMNEVSHLGIYVTERKMDITDKTFDYVTEKLKQKNRAEIVAQQKAGEVKIKDSGILLNMKDDMVDQKVNNMRTNDAVKYSVIELHCFQNSKINKEIIANDDPLAYQTSYSSRFGKALQNGFNVFAELALGIANLWSLVVIAAIAWFGFRYYKRRHSKPILNNI
jgi:Domain of unknown function (DUF4349)